MWLWLGVHLLAWYVALIPHERETSDMLTDILYPLNRPQPENWPMFCQQRIV